ncbi:hypothetical protein BGW41_004972 [Actinomortierella wolfii]|nr:hypothetical protein BGW41_004972 [Actinomortierella wolfii]
MGSALSRSPEAPPLSDLTGDREDDALLADYTYPQRDYGTTQLFINAPTVTALIKETRYCVINALDTSLTKDELGSLEIYLALLLPIVRTYREERHEYAAVYCFLLNRWQFLKEAEQDLANARLNETRLLKAFSMRQLIEVLTCDFAPIRRKDTRHRLLIPRMEGDVSTEPMSALEVAIEGKAKHFLNQLWLGNIVYFAQAIDEPETCINATHQEMRAVTLYDNTNIRFCRLSRLRVPRYKTTFQFVSLSTFVAVYTYVMFAKVQEMNTMEIALHDNTQSYGEISWLLLQVFLGSAFEGFDEADELGTFGRPLMVFFVAVSAVFLYTLLISIFSQTFSDVSANANEEFMFLFSLKVMEEVKSDKIYEFQPPFNIMAGIIVWPSHWIFDQYTVGKINRALLRFFYFPELVCIWIYEKLVLSKRPPYLPTRPSTRPGSTLPLAYTGSMGANYGGLNHSNGKLPAQLPSQQPSEQYEQQERLQESPLGVQYPESGSLGADTGAAASSNSMRPQQYKSKTAQPPEQKHPEGDGGASHHKIMSPSIESIQRFRDARQEGSAQQSATSSSPSSLLSSRLQGANNVPANNGSSSTGNTIPPPAAPTYPSSQTTGSGPTEHQVPFSGPYSYYPAYDAQHPFRDPSHHIRQQSMSGYGNHQFGMMRRRQGTEATLASTFQSGISFRDGFPDDGGDGGYEGDLDEWLTRMIDSRFDEMRERIDILDQKLDAIMTALGISA